MQTKEPVLFSRTRDVKEPSRGTDGSAGIDFFVPNDTGPLVLAPGEFAFIPSGIRVSLPSEYALIAFNKSGVALNRNLIVGACVVDQDYQGEIHLHVFNAGNLNQVINPGDKLIQMVLVPVMISTWAEIPDDALHPVESTRGSGGFGSTGVA